MFFLGKLSLTNFGSLEAGIPLDELHAKFECIALPIYYPSGARIEEFPDHLEKLLVSTTTHSKVKKLILNLRAPSPGFRGSEKAYKGPSTFGAESARINSILSRGAAWKGLEEIVLDMSGENPSDWSVEDIERIGEYLSRVSLPGLASTVKLGVLTQLNITFIRSPIGQPRWRCCIIVVGTQSSNFQSCSSGTLGLRPEVFRASFRKSTFLKWQSHLS